MLLWQRAASGTSSPAASSISLRISFGTSIVFVFSSALLPQRVCSAAYEGKPRSGVGIFDRTYVADNSLPGYIRIASDSGTQRHVHRDHPRGETLMFDCGEGTQRQMMRYGTSFSLRDIFFTHMHADHMLGVIGLFRTLSLQGREETMTLWGPPGSTDLLKRAIAIGSDKEKFPVEFREVSADTPVKRKDYSIVPSRSSTAAETLSDILSSRRRDSDDSIPILPASLAFPKDPCGGSCIAEIRLLSTMEELSRPRRSLVRRDPDAAWYLPVTGGRVRRQSKRRRMLMS
jgi:hypothetical protein